MLTDQQSAQGIGDAVQIQITDRTAIRVPNTRQRGKQFEG